MNELTRMKNLMGMSGQLYQKPIMEDESKHHGDVQPDPRDYKGGEGNPEYREALRHWEREHRPSPPSPPPPAPKAPKNISPVASKAKAGKGTGSSKLPGEFVMPFGRGRQLTKNVKSPSKRGVKKVNRVSKTKRTRKKKN